MFNTLMLERMKTQVLASRRERVERYVAAFERQPAILKPVDLHCCRIVSPVGLSLASIGFVLALINRKDYGPVFLIGLERVTGSGVQAVINHVLDAETLCDRIRKADSHALVINAKLNLARPVVCIALTVLRNVGVTLSLYSTVGLSLTTICTTSSFRTIHDRIIRRKPFAY